MRVNLLGPVELVAGSEPVRIPAAKPLAVAAALALAPSSVVSSGRLIELLWDEDPPETAENTLQYHISVLRRALGGDASSLRTRAPGYQWEVTTDLQEFEVLVQRAREAGSPERTASLAAQAIRLWRGPALADVREHPTLDAIAVGLDDRRSTTAELWAAAELANGRAAAMVDALTALTINDPTRERFWELQMLALYRTGRQADALAAFARARDQLGELVGIDPGPALQRLHQQVLQQDPALDLPPAAPAARLRPGGVLTDPVGTVTSTLIGSSVIAAAAQLIDDADGTVAELHAGRLVIGRAETAGIRVDDGRVSRFHAAIEPFVNGHRIRDLASTNGTRLNEQRITEPMMLRHGDRIRISDHRWTYLRTP